MLRDTILALDDANAVNLLSIFAKGQEVGGKAVPDWQPGMADGLEDALVVQQADEAGAVSRGDLARQALLVLAADPEYAGPIEALVAGPRTEAYGVVEGVVLVTALLVVLQTQLDFERDKAGRWMVKVKKPSADTELLKALAGKFLAFLGQ